MGGIILNHVLVKILEGRYPITHVIHELLHSTSRRIKILTLDSDIVLHFHHLR
jgi:hypothetical protein